MKKLKLIAKNLWEDESAQGATEYILLLVVVVAVVLLFRGKIKEMLDGRLDALGTGLSEVTTGFGGG